MDVKSYRKKPVVIRAIQYTGDNMDEIMLFIGARNLQDGQVRELTIETPEGNMKVRPGDYVIRGVKGELYPCKPDIFHATYEEEPAVGVDRFVGMSDSTWKPGDKVRYNGATDEQAHWGACSDPRETLREGEVYELERVEVHTWHTKIWLVGHDCNRGFNSASFHRVGP